ncbi:16S rRNA (guanine(527)-N(7))-methyltransferase RsmG [Sphingomonas sp. LT1P40]|uniref:16S rRNA (guanine(527)-N(7))-methyltransferase RsmG n=1 Tax=Alteristakelama amylovorans TaxID=3096166 RepID=UPI002FCA78A6
MTEDEARNWIRERYDVSRETKLAAFVDLLVEASAAQNLIAPSTLTRIWARHIVDSAQLLDHARTGAWLDIGSGAGLPGIVISILRADPVELVEPRKLRTAFLDHVIRSLALDHVTVVTAKVERAIGPPVAAITARAVAPLDEIFRMAAHRADRETVWVLPKGRNAESEVEVARHAWQGSFHVEPSITAPDSLIVVAREVRPR